MPTMMEEGLAQPEAESLLEGLIVQEVHSCPKAGMRAELVWQKVGTASCEPMGQ